MAFNDNPIEERGQDIVGRNSLAQRFADQVMDLDSSKGVVVGVLGPWGCGKTSFLNLARRHFDDRGIPVLEFNPWMFSNTGQLVKSFFGELAAQLRLNGDDTLSEIGTDFLNYAPYFLCLFPEGQIVSPLARIAGGAIGRRNRGVEHERRQIENALRELPRRIIVVIDDVDRLSTSEIRDVFKLVRLIANFPNIVYIVAFDRDRVESALDMHGIQGSDYLEKILQISEDLPVVPVPLMRRQICASLRLSLEQITDSGPFDDQVWKLVLQDIVVPLIRNLRDVNRFSVAFHTALRSFKGQIQVADVLALEAIRIFLPHVFKHLHSAIDPLTGSGVADSDPGDSRPRREQKVAKLIESAGDRSRVVESLVRRCFPAARHLVDTDSPEIKPEEVWIRERRIANEHILRLYIERRETNHHRIFTTAERAWRHMHSRTEFGTRLREVDPQELHEVIELLDLFKDQFTPDHIEPGTSVLINLFSEPDTRRRRFDEALEDTVTGIVRHLLNTLRKPSEREEQVESILTHLRSLSCKWKLISIVGHREEMGYKLVSKDAALVHEAKWRSDVRKATVDTLEKEQDLLGILLRTKRDEDLSQNVLKIKNTPRMTLALLRAARSKDEGGTGKCSEGLDWDALIELYGNKTVLGNRVLSLSNARIQGSQQLINLATSFLDRK